MAQFSKTFFVLIPPLEDQKVPPVAAAAAVDPNLRRSMRCTQLEESKF